jgi:CBS domain-containing protein
MTLEGGPMGNILDQAAAELPVRTIMASQPVTVEQHDSLRDVAKELAANEIGVVLVSSPLGPVGVISERDLVGVLAIGGDVEREQVKTVMSVDLVTAPATDSIAVVGRLMIDAGVRHVVIRDDDGRIIGVVSARDVLDAVLA